MIKIKFKTVSIILLISIFMPFSGIDNVNLGFPAYAKKASKSKRKTVKKFALNFKDVEISEFLNMMSQLIGKNIIIDDKVRGKISISSSRKVPLSRAYQIMKSILEVKGYAVIETPNLIKVIPIKDAVKKNVEIIVDGEKKYIEKDKSITYLLEIKKADANEITQTLNKLKSKNTQVVVFKSLNTVILSGLSTEIKGLVKIATTLDRVYEDEEDGPVSKGNIHIVHLENSNSEELAEVLSRIPFSDNAKINTSPIKKKSVRSSSKTRRITKSQSASRKKKSKLSIIANKNTNSLIIAATPDEFREIKRIIKELDIVREQVLIEALILEVTADNGWGFGIDWMLGGKMASGTLGGSSLADTSRGTGSLDISGKKSALPLAAGLQLGFISDSSSLGFALLNASATDNKFNIISTPQIVTIDNHEAEINVGEEIPVPTSTRQSDASSTSYTSFDYKSVGVKLKITPHITKKQLVSLELYQEVNSVLGQTTVLAGSIVPPKLGKRDIQTKVTVMNGKTIVVGGLIRNDKKITETKVPVLGDIPLLGWLFKHKTVSYEKTNLLIFITPHIVTSQKAIDAVTKRKKELHFRLRNQ